jgi:hypothetical protein
VEEEAKLEDVEAGVGSLIDKYGFDKIADTVARMAKRG